MRSILTILGFGAVASLMAWGAVASPTPAGGGEEAALAMAVACSAPDDDGQRR